MSRRWVSTHFQHYNNSPAKCTYRQSEAKHDAQWCRMFGLVYRSTCSLISCCHRSRYQLLQTPGLIYSMVACTYEYRRQVFADSSGLGNTGTPNPPALHPPSRGFWNPNLAPTKALFPPRHGAGRGKNTDSGVFHGLSSNEYLCVTSVWLSASYKLELPAGTRKTVWIELSRTESGGSCRLKINTHKSENSARSSRPSFVGYIRELVTEIDNCLVLRHVKQVLAQLAAKLRVNADWRPPTFWPWIKGLRSSSNLGGTAERQTPSLPPWPVEAGLRTGDSGAEVIYSDSNKGEWLQGRQSGAGGHNGEVKAAERWWRGGELRIYVNETGDVCERTNLRRVLLFVYLKWKVFSNELSLARREKFI